jgi:hypothetical protein
MHRDSRLKSLIFITGNYSPTLFHRFIFALIWTSHRTHLGRQLRDTSPPNSVKDLITMALLLVTRLPITLS